jgi:hypothetical protein
MADLTQSIQSIMGATEIRRRLSYLFQTVCPMSIYGIIPPYRKTYLIYEILRDLPWRTHAVARLPAVLSLATERSDMWRRFKSPTRVHAIYRKNAAAAARPRRRILSQTDA